MDSLQLVIGNKIFSSSSLRSWLLLREFNIDFEEIRIALFQPDTAEKLGVYSPSLKVPVLIHDEIKVWDSMAIAEYINDTFLEGRGWPHSTLKKAAARSICAELHSGFQQLGKDWPMNTQIRVKMNTTEIIEDEIARLDAIMYCSRRKYGQNGDYLFGNFSIADSMIAPFAVALDAYGAHLNEKSQRYVDTLLDNPHVQSWMDDANAEADQYYLEKAG